MSICLDDDIFIAFYESYLSTISREHPVPVKTLYLCFYIHFLHAYICMKIIGTMKDTFVMLTSRRHIENKYHEIEKAKSRSGKFFLQTNCVSFFNSLRYFCVILVWQNILTYITAAYCTGDIRIIF